MSARFKLDENLPRDARTILADAGHDVHSVINERLGGGPDVRVLEACLTEARILITLDLDFADIRAYPPSRHCGIWVLRPATQSIENVLAVLRGAMAILAKEPTDKRLWIVEHARVRIRE